MKKVLIVCLIALFVLSMGCGGGSSAAAPKADDGKKADMKKAEKPATAEHCKNCNDENCKGDCKGKGKHEKGECTGDCKEDCKHEHKKMVKKTEPAKVEKPVKKVEKPVAKKVEKPAPAADTKQGDGTLKNPVKVVMATDEIKIDGDLADWKGIAFLPAPFAKKDESMIKVTWREDGLYGAAVVKDDNIEVDDMNPWSADCLEFWIEKDNAKADFESENAAQYVFAPAADGKSEDKSTVVIPWGGFNDFPENVKCAWKKSDDGYVLEFMIPKKLMAPAKMAADTKIGLNFAVDNDGSPVQQFFCDKDVDAAYHIPEKWGTIILVK